MPAVDFASSIAPSSTPVPEITTSHIVPSSTSTNADRVRNTPTPRPTKTRTPVPTFTPETPPVKQNESYTLQEWTPAQADLLIDQIASHMVAIENDPEYMSVYGYSAYMSKFEYLAFAEKEALFRFPNSQQGERWQWDLCYNLALSYPYAESTDAPELMCYSKIIENGLNLGQTTIPQISNWFYEHESRFSFEIETITPPPGYNASYIIILENNAVLLLLEQDGVFNVTGLMSSMFFFRESGVKYQLVDLTGDNFPELVLYFGRSYCCGAMSFQFVYDLSLGNPKQLTFVNFYGVQSYVSSDYDSYITPLTDSAKPGLLFKSHYSDPLEQPCHFRKYDKYYWNSYQFELFETWLGIDPPSKYDDKELCQFAINLASNPDELSVIVNSIQQIRTPNFLAYREVIFFHLGEYYAQLGNWNKAAEYFSLVGAEPGDSKSEWKKSAQLFLENYQTENNFYRVCSKISRCNVTNAFKKFVENTKPEAFPLINEGLKKVGVSIKANGIFDFDGDETFEQWLVIQHPGKQTREFWILVKGATKIYALFVTETTVNNPNISTFLTIGGKYTFELGSQNEQTLYSLETLAISGQPYILPAKTPWNLDYYPNQKLYNAQAFWTQMIDDIAGKVLAGTDLAQANQILLELENSKEYGCKTYQCDQLYYLLGLINELMGDKQTAVNAYLQLWRNYPDSPYTIMARSKLEAIP